MPTAELSGCFPVGDRSVVFNVMGGASGERNMTEITVLLADDHAVVREGMRELIDREKDLKVVGEAENGKEAVEKVAELRPDVVLMDVDMPVLNGIEATRQVKAR